MKVYIFLILLILASCSHQKKVSMKPLKELTLATWEYKDMVDPITVSEAQYQADNNYVFDLYFLIANDAYYQGCFEIAHYGFVFLYTNDQREGSKEYMSLKLTMLREKLRERDYQYQIGNGAAYDEYFGYFCEEFKESIN